MSFGCIWFRLVVCFCCFILLFFTNIASFFEHEYDLDTKSAATAVSIIVMVGSYTINGIILLVLKRLNIKPFGEEESSKSDFKFP